MRDIVKRFFSKITADTVKPAGHATEHEVRVATCALFLEMAKIDETFTREEMEKILAILKEKYGLSSEHADELVAAFYEFENDSDANVAILWGKGRHGSYTE